jgi:hypothetical protein
MAVSSGRALRTGVAESSSKSLVLQVVYLLEEVRNSRRREHKGLDCAEEADHEKNDEPESGPPNTVQG